MLRHAIAPARFFSQLPNDVIRHARLSSYAVHLLAWQLSLPEAANERLSKSAERIGMGKTAFQKAKRELLAEGYLHEWRVQGDFGRRKTVQLVSNVPLTTEEAAAVRDGRLPAPEPGAAAPTVGEPTGRAVGGQPLDNTGENTSHQPLPQQRHHISPTRKRCCSRSDAPNRVW